MDSYLEGLYTQIAQQAYLSNWPVSKKLKLEMSVVHYGCDLARDALHLSIADPFPKKRPGPYFTTLKNCCAFICFKLK